MTKATLKSQLASLYIRLFPYLLAILFVVVIDLVFFFIPGVLMSGDLTFPIYSDSFRLHYSTVWLSYRGDTVDLASRLVFMSPIYLLSYFVSIDIVHASLILYADLILVVSAVYFIKTLAKYEFKELGKLPLWVIPLVAIISVTFHVITYRVGHYFFLPFIASLFVSSALLIRFYHTRKYTYLYALPVINFISSTSPHGIIFLQAYLSLFWIFIMGFILFAKEYKLKERFKKIFVYSFNYGLQLTIYFALNLYWIYHFMSLENAQPAYVLSREIIDMLTRSANPLNVIIGFSNWIYRFSAFEFINDNLTSWWVYAYIVCMIFFAGAGLFFSFMKLRISTFFSIIYVGILIVMTIFYMNTDWLFWVIAKSPFSSFGWLLRDIDKLTMFFAPTFIFWIILIVMKTKSSPKKYYFTIVSILVFVLISVFLRVSYNTSVYLPRYIPNEFYTLKNWIYDKDEAEEINGKVAWFPVKPEDTYWNDMPINIGNFPIWITDQHTFNQSPKSTKILDYALNSSNSIRGDLLNLMGVEYVFIRLDAADQDSALVADALDADSNFVKVFESGCCYSVYRNNVYNSDTTYDTPPLFVSGGLNNLATLLSLEGVDSSKIHVVNTDYSLDNREIFKDSFEKGNLYYFVGGDSILEDVANFIGAEYMYFPAGDLENSDITEYWSKYYADDRLHGNWTGLLKGYGLTNYDFDYGEGYAVTNARYRFINEVEKAEPEESHQYNCDYVEKASSTSLYELRCDSDRIDATLETKIERRWATIELIKQEIDSETPELGVMSVVDIDASNVEQLHVKLQFFDSNDDVLKTDYVIGGQDGSVNSIFSKNSVIPAGTSYYKLRLLWKGSDSKVIVNNARIYDMSDYLEENILSVPVVPSEEDSLLLVSYFENEKGGELKLSYGDGVKKLNTWGSSNEFKWEIVDSSVLTDEVRITSLSGFNAINSIALVPKSQYESIELLLDELYSDESTFIFKDVIIESSNEYLSGKTTITSVNLFDEIGIEKSDYFNNVSFTNTICSNKLVNGIYNEGNELLGCNSSSSSEQTWGTDLDYKGDVQLQMVSQETLNSKAVNLQSEYRTNSEYVDLEFFPDRKELVGTSNINAGDNRSWIEYQTEIKPLIEESYKFNFKGKISNLDEFHIKLILLNQEEKEALPVYLATNPWEESSFSLDLENEIINVDSKFTGYYIQILHKPTKEGLGQFVIEDMSFIPTSYEKIHFQVTLSNTSVDKLFNNFGEGEVSSYYYVHQNGYSSEFYVGDSYTNLGESFVNTTLFESEENIKPEEVVYLLEQSYLRNFAICITGFILFSIGLGTYTVIKSRKKDGHN
jgi:hypothetical protein